MTFGSLFSGIGGLDLGLEWAGMKCKWQVERDGDCRSRLRKNWPNVPRFDDVRTFLTDETFTEPRFELENIDLLCGGFPCQDVSNAGQNRGIAEGTRSGLWLYFLNAIRHLRPNYVLVENVSGLRKGGEGYLGTVLRGLAESGYDAEWDSIPASFFGAPQERERVAIIGYPNGERRMRCKQAGMASPIKADTGTDHGIGREGRDKTVETAFLSASLSSRPRLPGSIFQRAGIRSAEISTPTKFGNRVISCGGYWWQDIECLQLDYGVPTSVVRQLIKAYGNAVVPQWSEMIGKLIMEDNRLRQEN